MRTYKTRPIGEIFKFYVLKLQVIEGETCEGCFFKSNVPPCLDCRYYTGYCSGWEREDNKRVIFKLIDE